MLIDLQLDQKKLNTMKFNKKFQVIHSRKCISEWHKNIWAEYFFFFFFFSCGKTLKTIQIWQIRKNNDINFATHMLCRQASRNVPLKLTQLFSLFCKKFSCELRLIILYQSRPPPAWQKVQSISPFCHKEILSCWQIYSLLPYLIFDKHIKGLNHIKFW